jgi:hypothetical protein
MSANEWKASAWLFQGRKQLSYNGLIVMEEAAPRGTKATERTANMAIVRITRPPTTQNYICLKSTFSASIGGEIATAKE